VNSVFGVFRSHSKASGPSGAGKVAVIKRPSLFLTQEPSKETKAFLEAREVVTCIQRIRAVGSKGSYLKLADGRGLVFEFSQGKQTLCRRAGEDPVIAPLFAGSPKKQELR